MRFAMKSLLGMTLVLGALLAACSSTTEAVVETVAPTSAAEVLAESEDAVLLDIRTPEEYAEARITGATNVDFYAADFTEQVEQLARDGTYVVYCRSDNRSGQAMETFRDLGFAEVYEIDGGIVNWYDSGFPVES